MAETRAQSNRRIRQEALREQLASQGHLQHILEITDKLQELDEGVDNLATTKLKIVIDTKLKLLNKYLPDLKAVDVEMDANLSGGIKITWDSK